VDIHAMLKPARAVGGDFYDFFFIGQDSLCLLAADVAGKGIPAALFMAVSRTLVRANAELAHSPSELLSKVNEELSREGNTSGMFVSLVLALIDVRTGAMQVCNAGHPAPLRLTSEGKVEPLPTEPGVALGAWLNSSYRSTRHQLHPGDTLVFYTDGITEALDPDEKFYTTVRLANILGDMAGQSAERIVRGVTQDVRTFCGAHEQADDLTLLVLRWNGPPARALGEKVGEWEDSLSTAP
jgi:sigma-B regulation protein RsbU (phosphoserine phosphatase)